MFDPLVTDVIIMTTTLRSAIHRCVQGFSVEITPRQAGRIASFEGMEGLVPGRRVNVVCLPAFPPAADQGHHCRGGGNAFAASLATSVATCERLRREGFTPTVPSDGTAFAAHHWAHSWMDGFGEELKAHPETDVLMLDEGGPAAAA